MKKTILIIAALVASFGLGYAFNSISEPADKPEPKKATGIGGVFFKCKDPKKLKEWYSKHLGLKTDTYGTVFEWRQGADTTKKGFTQWSPFKSTTKYFGNSGQTFMINYRVENLEWLITQFKKDSVIIVDTMEVVDYGKFLHILDGEGNKVELWEPYDEQYGKITGGITK